MNEVRTLFEHPLIVGLLKDELTEVARRANDFFGPPETSNLKVTKQSAITKDDWREFGRQGFLGMGVPIELGGHGLGHLAAFILSSALARTLDVGLSLGMHVHNDVAMGWLVATQQQKVRDRFLPEMIQGKLIGCTCFTEHGEAQRTRAERQGNKLVINGHKAFAINGLLADLCFLTAELDGRLCTILVEKDAPGVHVTKEQDKLGALSIDQADISFTNTIVSADNIVSKPGLQQLLHWNNVMTTARAHVAFDGFMMMKILFEYMLSYSRNRIVGGRPLGSWSIQQQEFANAYVNLEIVRANLANFIQVKTNNNKANPVEEMAALKNFSIESAYEFSLKCCDMQGGRGFMNDSLCLHIAKQIMALRYSTGSQYMTNEIASAYHRESHKRKIALKLPQA